MWFAFVILHQHRAGGHRVFDVFAANLRLVLSHRNLRFRHFGGFFLVAAVCFGSQKLPNTENRYKEYGC